ncbi:MAG: hypothetical protein WB615_00585 [Candidatus Tumulicola sp.]
MSTKKLRKAIASIDLDEEAPYLILGRKTGAHLLAGTYPISEDMQHELRGIAQAALERIDDLEMSDYAGPTGLEAGTEGLYVPSNRLNANAELLGLLASPDALPTLKSQEIGEKPLSFFGIGIGSSSDNRVFFVRKQLRTLRASHLLFAIFAKELDPVKTDIVSFDRATDFILCAEGAVVFDMRAFEKYVQDPDDIAEELSSDLSEVGEVLPIDEETLSQLSEKAEKGALLRRKIRSIVESEHFATLTLDAVKAAFRGLGRDPRKYIKGNKLNFPVEEAAFVLKVLDQSAWAGAFDGKTYSTNAKRAEI